MKAEDVPLDTELMGVAYRAYIDTQGDAFHRLCAALAAVIPLVQAAEREACAEVATEFGELRTVPSNKWVAKDIAAAIRARKPA